MDKEDIHVEIFIKQISDTIRRVYRERNDGYRCTYVRLTDHQRDDLLDITKRDNIVMVERALIILLRDTGISCDKIAEVLDRSEKTIRKWIKLFNHYGVSGLSRIYRRGQIVR